jgi:hypothetical protein
MYLVSNTVSTVAPDPPGAVLTWGGDRLREALGCWPITRATRLSRWRWTCSRPYGSVWISTPSGLSIMETVWGSNYGTLMGPAKYVD